MEISDSSNLFFNDVPESLLIEILARLPSRTAAKFKSVCKRWNSLISSDYFVTYFNHRRHDTIHDPDSLPFQFQLARITECKLVSILSAEDCAVPKFDLGSLDGVVVRASCYDLILCSSSKEGPVSSITNFFVCDTKIKQWIELPPAFDCNDCAVGLLCVPPPCSLCHRGVDSSRCKFVVVRIQRPEVDKPLHVHSFSSEEAQWRRHEVSRPSGFRSHSCRGYDCDYLIPYKGMLHYLSYPRIYVFDPYNSPERFSRVIELPTPHQDSFLLGFGLCQDHLRVAFCYTFDYVWELEDYDTAKWSFVQHGYAVVAQGGAQTVSILTAKESALC